MEFLPHTQAALDEYLTLADPDLSESLMTMGERATRIVPDCVGLSLCLYEEGLTFTLVASHLRWAELDAMQYLEGGPCVTAVERNEVYDETIEDLLSEQRWLLFAQASAAAGVASSLSLPLLDQDRVVGGINLYASTREAFDGHHEDLAGAIGASALGAVTNSDLAFESRHRAEEAPGRLRERRLVEVAVGIVAARESVDVETASAQLAAAARRAGITEAQAAQVLIEVHQRH